MTWTEAIKAISDKNAEIERLEHRLADAYANQTFKEWERNQKLITELTAAVLNLTRNSSQETYELYKDLIRQGETIRIDRI
jgi:hypothetical protein